MGSTLGLIEGSQKWVFVSQLKIYNLLTRESSVWMSFKTRIVFIGSTTSQKHICRPNTLFVRLSISWTIRPSGTDSTFYWITVSILLPSVRRVKQFRNKLLIKLEVFLDRCWRHHELLKQSGPEVTKLCFLLNSAEHEIRPANKSQITSKCNFISLLNSFAAKFQTTFVICFGFVFCCFCFFF